MQFEITRTRMLYEHAAPGIRSLDGDAQCCATICATGYAGILRAIERRKYDTLSGRAHIGAFRKALVMANAWRTTRYTVTEGAQMDPQPHADEPLRA